MRFQTKVNFKSLLTETFYVEKAIRSELGAFFYFTDEIIEAQRSDLFSQGPRSSY